MQELSIPEIQAQMDAGTLSAQALTESYLDRIDRLNRRGPRLHAIICTNPDAPATAAALDAERAAKGPRSLLHGIPILLKDNIDTADKMPTTAGSLALAKSMPVQDAFITQKLRAAGAVILGKANLSEWANFRSTRSTSGWSSVGGQTRNPYVLNRNPCGSSSGSAVSVAANLCTAAIGTETDGSIACPSGVNGIVGIKPTVGLVSRAGIVPIAHSQDTAGPMARSVTDAAILLGILTGVDAQDEMTRESNGRFPSDYTPFLDKDGLRGARIGIARNYFGYHPQVDALIEQAIDILRDCGAVIIDPANMATAKQFDKTEMEVLLYEFKHDLNQYLAGLSPNTNTRTLQDLIAFNEQHREQVMPHFAQELFLQAQAKGPLTEAAYLEALAANHRLARDEGINATLNTHQLDAIVAPTNKPAWLTDWINGDHHGGGCSSAAAVAGYPHITVPAGYVQGLPIGLSFFGDAYQEPTLIRLAYAFEQATQIRRAPEFLHWQTV